MSEEVKVMDGQTSFDGVIGDNTKSKTDVMDVEKALSDAIENERLQDEEDKKSVKESNGIRYHESHTDRRTVRSILKRYADHEIAIPACQRLYVWNQKQRDGLMDSVRKGLPCGSITLCTLEDGDGTLYLIDGLQRLTSLLLMSNDKDLSDEDKTKVSNYQLGMEIVYNMTLDEMSEYFIKKNSGIAVSAATKNNASLPKRIQEIGMKLSRHEFFQNIADKANVTFSKNEHNKVIAWNTLLACAGIEVDSIKSADITKRLTEYEADIINHVDDATKLIERLSVIYSSVADDKFIKRSMNANFVSILVYVIHDHPEFTNEQIVNCISTIFAKGKAIAEYSTTTGGTGACKDNCKRRYNAILNVLMGKEQKIYKNEETPKAEKSKAKAQDVESSKADTSVKPTEPSELLPEIDEAAFHTFCKQHTGKILNTRSSDYPVEFNDMNDEERRMLYRFCDVEPDKNRYEGVIMKAFRRVEKIKDNEKESA